MSALEWSSMRRRKHLGLCGSATSKQHREWNPNRARRRRGRLEHGGMGEHSRSDLSQASIEAPPSGDGPSTTVGHGQAEPRGVLRRSQVRDHHAGPDKKRRSGQLRLSGSLFSREVDTTRSGGKRAGSCSWLDRFGTLGGSCLKLISTFSDFHTKCELNLLTNEETSRAHELMAEVVPSQWLLCQSCM